MLSEIAPTPPETLPSSICCCCCQQKGMRGMWSSLSETPPPIPTRSGTVNGPIQNHITMWLGNRTNALFTARTISCGSKWWHTVDIQSPGYTCTVLIDAISNVTCIKTVLFKISLPCRLCSVNKFKRTRQGMEILILGNSLDRIVNKACENRNRDR